MIPIDIDKSEVEQFSHLLTHLKRLTEDGVTPLIEKQTKWMLENAIPFFSALVLKQEFPEIRRLTVNKNILGKNKRISDIKYLKYPPKEYVSKYGRCNLPQQSVLYASFMMMTTLSELKPRTGDLITKSTWRLKDNYALTYCPIFKNQPKAKDIINPRTHELNQIYEENLKLYPENIKLQIDNLTQFIADVFTKRINRDNHLDYIFSAFFSDRILNSFENGSIEAIYYPSVQDNLSFENLAIKPEIFDKHYYLYEVKDSVVVMDPSDKKGGYFMHGLSECKSFDYASGKILWGNVVRQPDEILNHFKKEFGVDIESTH